MTYRKIWEQHYGKIQKDKNGVSFEIHHIDGNHFNNDINNLRCMSILDHFYVHLSQGDFAAAHLILTKIKNINHYLDNFDLTPSDLAKYMVENKLGVWSDESKIKALETKRKLKVGYYHDFNIQSKAGKIGGPLGIKITHELMKERKTGIYSTTHQSKAGKIGGSKSGKLQLGKEKPKVICPHCGKIGGGQALMNRWHFNNCKSILQQV